MKNFALFIALLLLTATIGAQSYPGGPRIEVGYFGAFAIQPGGSVSMSIPLDGQAGNYILRPQIAVFTNPDNHVSILSTVSANRQWNRERKERWRYHRLGLGVGLGLQYEQLGLTVNLGDGQITDRDRVEHTYFFPHLTYGYGRWLGSRWGVYGHLGVGHQFGLSEKGRTLINTSLGVFFALK